MTDHSESLVVREDFSGSGRVTQVLLGGVLVWTWAWHIDGPPSSDLQSLLDALPTRDPQCPNSYDIHCSHWYDGATCCRCGERYPSVTEEP